MGPRMIWGKRDERVAGSGRRWHAAETSTVKSTTRGWHRDYSRYPLVFGAVPALFSLMLFVPSYAAAAENEDVAALRRMLGELKAENRKLSERLSALEGDVGDAADQARCGTSTSGTCRDCGGSRAHGYYGTARRSARSARTGFVRSRSEAAA